MSNDVAKKVLAELVNTIVKETRDSRRAALDKQTNYLYIGRNAINAAIDANPSLRKRNDLPQFKATVYRTLRNKCIQMEKQRPSVKWDKEHKDLLVFESVDNKNVYKNLVQPFIHKLKTDIFSETNRHLVPLKIFLFGTVIREQQEKQLHESAGQHLHYGHVFGQAARAAERLESSLKESSEMENLLINAAGLNKTEYNRLRINLRRVIKIDASLHLVRDVSETKSKVIAVFELADDNLSTGGESGSYLKKVKAAIDTVDIVTLSGSKSMVEALDDVFQDCFYDRPVRKYKGSTKVKASKRNTLKASVSVKTIKSAVSKGSTRKAAPKVNYISLQRQINASLHDTLKHYVMGKGTAKELLNYRTGRFAESVKVTKITPPTGNLRQHTIDVRYMYNPYMVFAPGGRLYKINRDPQRLAGRAIRKIIKDEAITALNNPKIRVAY